MSRTRTIGGEAPAHDGRIDAAIARLRKRFLGRVILPQDAAYDDARRVWNGMIDRYPRLVVRPLDTDDVAAAIAFATETRLPLAVRGGGHNVAGYGTCDGGIVLDLSSLREVDVDAGARIARVGGGATWADVDEATARHGLVVPGGEVSATGVAGLTLSGGYGMLRRTFGLTCDNLLAAEVVTARGERVRASEDEHPDLFWALRGGGGNFGVVTRFEFRLHPLGPDVFKLTVAYDRDDMARILRGWREYLRDVPDEVTTAAYAWRVAPIPEFPEELHDREIFVLEGMYGGAPEDGERAFAPLRELATPLFDVSGVVPYLESQRSLDAFVPPGRRYYWKSLHVNGLSDAVIAEVERGAAAAPHGFSLVVLRHLGGAIERVPEDATAYGNRRAPFNLSIDATWDDPAEDDAHVSWARGLWRAMGPHAAGVYLNFTGLAEEGEALVRAGHGSNFERLARIKARYDPDNLFRSNQNIAPASLAAGAAGGGHA